MPLLQQPAPSVSSFETSSPAPPPPYTVTEPQQLPTPTPPPNQAQSQFGQPQNVFPQGQPQIQQQVQNQQPQFVQSPQGPVMQQPMQTMAPQQPLQFPQNMTPQQQQQVQTIIQNMPPEKLQIYQQQAQQMMAQPQFQQAQQTQIMSPQPIMPQPMPTPPQQGQPPRQFTQTAPSGLFGKKHSSGGHGGHGGPADEKQTGGVQRFFGDTLFGRVARASVQTATSAMKMPASLSPWGDNNPVTLPNVRYRDAVLFTTFAFVGAPLVEGLDSAVTDIFGADSFVSEIVSSGAGTIVGSTIIKYSVFQIVEQAIDKGIIEHMLPEEEKMLQTTNVKSLQVGIKHKLMGVDADLRFVGIYPTGNTQGCDKGWFCPYLFASARTPQIPRANDFAVCQFFGPFLGGDYQLAHKLLSESAHTLALCDPNPHTDIGTNRMVIVFTGISPFRANMWSTSRRPGCGTIVFHLLDGCPALIIPVTSKAPVCAWSPWTLAQMRLAQYSLNPTQGMYNPEWQHEQVCEWLDTVISVQHITESVRERYVDVLGRMVSLVINGALALEKCQPLLGKLDPERSGVVMFRY
ncbi:hypothetical protein BDV96DRAFT_605045 [Lophiotrema nucula]|uniref:Uncharacterized protein n=1 Tax=Lophiotrema nucula TaxID=690887 RepID=A0A6A5YS07_9PLEO|nr:hypothetical protein BDV96DRAFT_605045 [Lophiotrema nucula]